MGFSLSAYLCLLLNFKVKVRTGVKDTAIITGVQAMAAVMVTAGKVAMVHMEAMIILAIITIVVTMVDMDKDMTTVSTFIAALMKRLKLMLQKLVHFPFLGIS